MNFAVDAIMPILRMRKLKHSYAKNAEIISHEIQTPRAGTIYRSMVGCLPQLRLWVQSLGLQKLKTKQTTKRQTDRWVSTDSWWMLFENASMSKSKRRWFHWWAVASELGGVCLWQPCPIWQKLQGPALQGGLIKASILQQQKGHWLGNSANVGYI